jgi:hypothetical protein
MGVVGGVGCPPGCEVALQDAILNSAYFSIIATDEKEVAAALYRPRASAATVSNGPAHRSMC